MIGALVEGAYYLTMMTIGAAGMAAEAAAKSPIVSRAVPTVVLANMLEDNPDLQRWLLAATAVETAHQHYHLKRHDRAISKLLEMLEELGVEIDDDGNLWY